MHEVTHMPMLIAGTFVPVFIDNICPSVEATADDLPTIKAALRTTLPVMKPTHRLEYIARSYGFGTAAALQAALSRATRDAPCVLTPVLGPIDEQRSEYLASLGDSLTEEMRDAHAAVARSIVNRRSRIGFVYEAPGLREKRGCVYALDGRISYHIPELCVPDFRSIFPRGMMVTPFDIETFFARLPDKDRIFVMDETIPPIMPLHVARLETGVVPPATPPAELPLVAKPEVTETSFRGTMLLRRGMLGEIVGFVTFRMEIAPVSEDEAARVVRENPYFTDAECEALTPQYRAQNFVVNLHVEACGTQRFWNTHTERPTRKQIEDWSAVDLATHSAFMKFLKQVFLAIAFELRSGTVSYAAVRVDVTCDGRYFGNSCYDRLAVDLHTILASCSEISNNCLTIGQEIEVEMRLDQSVYSFADEAFDDAGIIGPYYKSELDELERDGF